MYNKQHRTKRKPVYINFFFFYYFFSRSPLLGRSVIFKVKAKSSREKKKSIQEATMRVLYQVGRWYKLYILTWWKKKANLNYLTKHLMLKTNCIIYRQNIRVVEAFFSSTKVQCCDCLRYFLLLNYQFIFYYINDSCWNVDKNLFIYLFLFIFSSFKCVDCLSIKTSHQLRLLSWML